ncbi:hypothetical protein [Nocardiopsis halophila]|uniref:hypothetical protein n=1 Tax=Nocardiopsis halophila TaxID=141692 RepID=UPI0003471D74|nr:hypothetical protein [Nocardiopsis halophila]
MPHEQLVVADYRAARTYALAGGSVRELGGGVLAEHAGFLALPHGGASGARHARWAYADDRAGALVVGGPAGERRHPIAIPAEHLACDPAGRHVAVTTGAGANAEPWSDVVTLVDLDDGEPVRFRVRTGEPGVVIAPDRRSGEAVLLIRHREPGAIEAVPLERAAAAGPHVPELRGATTHDIADDGHGDVVDQRTGTAATATRRGLERFAVEDGLPRPLGTVPWPVAGRAYYLRFDPATGCALGVVRGPGAPDAWTSWTNALVEIDLETGRTRHADLPPGLAFRFALGGGRAAVATIHPDGDRLTLIDRSGPRMRTLWQTALPAMSHPPAPGRLPWEPVGDAPAQRRAVALDPSGTTAAVTRGGDGEIHLVREEGTETVALPSPLHEGGHLLWPSSSPGAGTDPVGR